MKGPAGVVTGGQCRRLAGKARGSVRTEASWAASPQTRPAAGPLAPGLGRKHAHTVPVSPSVHQKGRQEGQARQGTGSRAGAGGALACTLASPLVVAKAVANSSPGVCSPRTESPM